MRGGRRDCALCNLSGCKKNKSHLTKGIEHHTTGDFTCFQIQGHRQVPLTYLGLPGRQQQAVAAGCAPHVLEGILAA
eukprot:1160415-Pelagomonas_calceolata.AAC.8